MKKNKNIFDNVDTTVQAEIILNVCLEFFSPVSNIHRKKKVGCKQRKLAEM